MLRTMIRARIAPILLLGLFTACAHAKPQAPDAGPEAGLDALLDRQAEDWNQGDLEGFCAVYAEDATFISPSGVHQGRAQILARYQAKYDTAEKRGVLSFEPIETRYGKETASIALKWKIQKAESQASGHALIVLHQTAAGWRIVQDASM